MFDNESDWVMRIEAHPRTELTVRLDRRGAAEDDAIQGRAHCRAVEAQRMQVFNVRRVSLGVNQESARA